MLFWTPASVLDACFCSGFQFLFWTPASVLNLTNCPGIVVVQSFTRGCGLWEWLDEEYPESTKEVINCLIVDKQNLEATVAALQMTLMEKDKELDSLRIELAAGDVKKQEYLKDGTRQNEICNMYLKWQRRLIVVLVLAVFILIKKEFLIWSPYD